MSANWQDDSYITERYQRVLPTAEENTERYIRTHISMIPGTPAGIIPDRAKYHPPEKGQPAYLYCPDCMARITTWNGAFDTMTNRRTCLRYSIKLCDCQRGHDSGDTGADMERNRHRRVVRNLLMQSGLTGRGLNARFDNTCTDRSEIAKAKAKAQQFCKAYLDDRAGDGNGLYLSGAPGTGKTHLACCVAWEFVRSEKSVLYLNELELYRRIIDDRDKGLMKQCHDVSLLVLDDVGKESTNHKREELLYQLIDYRYQAMKPTIYTSQYTLDNLTARGWDRATLDRMAQTSHRVSTGYGESFRIDLMPTT